MNVYVLHAYWENKYDSGSEIFGVYSEDNFEKAREDMLKNVSEIKSDYQPDIWEDDYTYEDNNSITFGYNADQSFEPATIYGWEILLYEVQRC